MFDGLAMTQDSVNEQQVGHVPAKGEPRADRFYIGGQIKFRKPWTYFVGTNYNGLDAEPEPSFPGWTSPWTSRSRRGWAA